MGLLQFCNGLLSACPETKPENRPQAGAVPERQPPASPTAVGHDRGLDGGRGKRHTLGEFPRHFG